MTVARDPLPEKLELLHRDGDESYELRADGRRVALVDRMLFESLVHRARVGDPIPFLECVAIPEARTHE